MALTVNIEQLLSKERIESNRIEYKTGWNPPSIYHSICAFANDFDDLSGGYIVVGVETDETTGMAIRPVAGLPIEKIDGILQEMVGYNNKISPYYMPRTSVEDVDGTQVLVIWCPAGSYRPYSVPENVSAKNSKEQFYIRSGTSSIVAKGEILDELRDLASRTPFDERGNADIHIEDISILLLREYLVKAKSKLLNDLYTKPLEHTLEQMDLYVGPKENRLLRNVAAMMFCEYPEKFFKRTWVETVFFPEGRLNNPNNMYEGPVMKGSITQIIERTSEYLKRMLVMQSVRKPTDDNRSIKYYTYPYQAIEESIANSLYHRDYREWEPNVVTIEPDGITIQNIGGPDRSIARTDIEQGNLLISKRYRNRRLGEFIKEMGLTEGRSTGIPTIQNALKDNGSPRATVVTDEDRTFFRITIPCHQSAGNIITDIANKDQKQQTAQKIAQKTSQKTSQKQGKHKYENTEEQTIGLGIGVKEDIEEYPRKDFTKDCTKDLTKDLTNETQQTLIKLIRQNPHITTTEMAAKVGLSRRTIATITGKLQAAKVIARIGTRKSGQWTVVADKN